MTTISNELTVCTYCLREIISSEIRMNKTHGLAKGPVCIDCIPKLVNPKSRDIDLNRAWEYR